MQTRSQGSDNLLRYRDDIDRIHRELREQQATLDLLVMANEANVNELLGNIGAGDAPRNHHQRAELSPLLFRTITLRSRVVLSL